MEALQGVLRRLDEKQVRLFLASHSSPILPPSPTPTPPPPYPYLHKASFEQALRSQAKKVQRHTYTLFLRRPCLCVFFLLLLLVPFLNGLLLVAFGGCYHRNVFFFLAR